ncbi:MULTISPECIES: hypothetical protein [unclassified Microbacterium]|uniref:hypothetical protein n=1 Tax=unclassified Microbacterium TaxID=2609290 RepID=UPI0037453462
MGTNRRYADQIDRRMDERILERLAREGPLQSLSDNELELTRLPMTKDPRPSTVTAWVRFGQSPTRVQAEAVAWTPRAVAIRFTVAGRELRAWVWASAVERHD